MARKKTAKSASQRPATKQAKSRSQRPATKQAKSRSPRPATKQAKSRSQRPATKQALPMQSDLAATKQTLPEQSAVADMWKGAVTVGKGLAIAVREVSWEPWVRTFEETEPLAEDVAPWIEVTRKAHDQWLDYWEAQSHELVDHTFRSMG